MTQLDEAWDHVGWAGTTENLTKRMSKGLPSSGTSAWPGTGLSQEEVKNKTSTMINGGGVCPTVRAGLDSLSED